MSVHNSTSDRRDPGLQPSLDVPAEDEVGRDDADPARREFRAEIGKYVSLTAFPTDTVSLVATAAGHGAPDQVVHRLRMLPWQERFRTPRDLWLALDLEAAERF